MKDRERNREDYKRRHYQAWPRQNMADLLHFSDPISEKSFGKKKSPNGPNLKYLKLELTG